MIYDKFEDGIARHFGSVDARALGAVADTWRKFLAKFPEPGRYDVCDGVYCTVQEYDSRPADPCKLEYHREYADIQTILSGHEEVWCAPIDGETVVPYDAGRDIGFVRMNARPTEIRLDPGWWLLLEPGEGHMPCVGDGSKVVKVVFKLEKKLLV
ncbi:MAG: YhcH/YjgK/YiaL family protein [Victivallaceae bacterium]|nr:YhcH/YjgK/YiaL family protein [Victivallaceae bacterium]